MSDMLQIVAGVNETRADLILSGPLDSQGAAVLKDEGRELHQRGVRTLVIDCSAVSFISSSGVGSFLILQDEFEAGGGLACYRDPSPEVRSVIRLMDLECILNIVTDEEGILKLMDGELEPPSKEPPE